MKSLLLLSKGLAAGCNTGQVLLVKVAVFALSSFKYSFSPGVRALVVLEFVRNFNTSLFVPDSLTLLFVSCPSSAGETHVLKV